MRKLCIHLLLCAAVLIVTAAEEPGDVRLGDQEEPSKVEAVALKEAGGAVLEDNSTVAENVALKEDNRVTHMDSVQPERNQALWCPGDWTPYGSRCFRFFPVQRTWIDAEFFCQRYGGHLASVHSREEHLFLLEMIRGAAGDYVPTWIGGHDAIKTNTWLWIDGSCFDFQTWNQGEPNGGDMENCLEMNWEVHRGWNDLRCNEVHPHICSISERC